MRTGEFDGAGTEGPGDVFEQNLHGRDVCCSTSLGVREDMATHAAAGGFKDPCSGIAGHYNNHTTSATVRPLEKWMVKVKVRCTSKVPINTETGGE